VKTRICPRYEGSVIDSGYPTREVVKTASPEMLDFAPKDLPWKTGPSCRVKSQPKFFVPRTCVTYPDCECSSIVRDRSSLRTSDWHLTANTAFDCG
jgi:hypothetical protein